MTIAWRFAWRELRGGLAGLRLLAICLFLGVAGLAGVASLSSAIVDGLNARGQAILGGDIEMRVSQRQAAPAERAAFAQIGTVSESVKMRAMVSTADAGRSVLGELKGIDDRWPLYGDFRLQPGALARRPDGQSVAIAPALADRLSVKVGDMVRLGEGRFRVIGLIAEEPDSVGEGFALGPTVLTDMRGIATSRLVQPGSLF
ncbi:MAG: hypothetical protein JWR77_1939, partial [Rhizorhabdus sp.]|nr:hypothetical protein [Rhizorhabdus sp.]